MTLTNHFITGVSIAVATKNPFIALPLALVSHYLLDSLPHYGFKDYESRNKLIFFSMIIFDLIIFALLIKSLISWSVPTWYFLAGVFAYLPDFAWYYTWAVTEKFGSLAPNHKSRLNNFHMRIQKYERLWGIVPEIVYGTALFILIRGTFI